MQLVQPRLQAALTRHGNALSWEVGQCTQRERSICLEQQGGPPDDEGLLVIPLRGEGYDVVGALQLRKRVRTGVPLKLHTATACFTVHDTCTLAMLQTKLRAHQTCCHEVLSSGTIVKSGQRACKPCCMRSELCVAGLAKCPYVECLQIASHALLKGNTIFLVV